MPFYLGVLLAADIYGGAHAKSQHERHAQPTLDPSHTGNGVQFKIHHTALLSSVRTEADLSRGDKVLRIVDEVATAVNAFSEDAPQRVFRHAGV